MNAASTTGIRALLTELEGQSAAVRASLGSAGSGQDVWTGVACRVGERRLVLARAALRELVPVTDLTFVPGTPDWVRGVLNLRGQVLPVYDLNRLFGGELTVLARVSRILVVEHRESLAGLLVDEVFGFRSFDAGTAQDAGQVPDGWSDCFPGCFTDDQHEWLELDTLALFTSPHFIQMARGSQT